jgi:hypothetical protein
MSRMIWSAALLICGAGLLAAQPSGAAGEALRLAVDMRASYYHPDRLTGFKCGVRVDFNKVFEQIGLPISPEALEAANSASIVMRSTRDNKTEIEFIGSGKENSRREVLEKAVSQVVRGIFGITGRSSSRLSDSDPLIRSSLNG